jgi:TIR domain
MPPEKHLPGPDPRGTNSSRPDANLSVGHSWEDFFVVENLPIGHPPTITGYIRPDLHAVATSSATIEPSLMRILDPSEVSEIREPEERGLSQLQIKDRPEDLPPKSTPDIFISYAWGDNSSENSRKRGEVVEQLCEKLGQDGWNIIRDKDAMRSGDLISGFMKRIGLADRVIVVLSDKYLRSPYCMSELYSIYQRSVGEKEEFLRRIIPLVLDDARFGTPEERVEYAEHWELRYKTLTSKVAHFSVEDFRLYKAMQKWHLDIGEMLCYLNDVLTAHGFDEIVQNDFAGIRQMLSGPG